MRNDGKNFDDETTTGRGTVEDRGSEGGGRGRLTAPRMSLLGRPINYRATRRDARYRRIQTNFYNFLERPRGVYAITYHMIVFFMVFMCLVLSVFSTIDEYEKDAGLLLYYMELVVLIWFSGEFCFRSKCIFGKPKFLRITIIEKDLEIKRSNTLATNSEARLWEFFTPSQAPHAL
ncbi:hypothetical protein KQX54_007432 [Cotesia glomerata]|uniref:Ion transport domain-containing protein n=1 Tax=Cotesia glomerata TaxID=32391 RepID=A0AAV7ILL8_COTGL|nr:hypothetical protein KQX54_007432 [Cotesia glomerata]